MRSYKLLSVLTMAMSLSSVCHGLEDPTRPTGVRTAVASTVTDAVFKPLRLQAIISRSADQHTDAQLLALINDDLLKVGDRHADFEIVQVLKDRVVIERQGGQRSELLLNAEIKDKP